MTFQIANGKVWCGLCGHQMELVRFNVLGMLYCGNESWPNFTRRSAPPPRRVELKMVETNVYPRD